MKRQGHREAPNLDSKRLKAMTVQELAGLMRLFSAMNDTALNVCNQPRHRALKANHLDDVWNWTGLCADQIERELTQRPWETSQEIEIAAWAVLECKAKYADDLANFTLLSATFAEQSVEAEIREFGRRKAA